MATAKVQRDAVALVVLAHPLVGMSVTKAAKYTGVSKQRFHQRLGDAARRGWVTSKPWELTPRGQAVVDKYRGLLAELEASRGKIDLREVMAGEWG